MIHMNMVIMMKYKGGIECQDLQMQVKHKVII